MLKCPRCDEYIAYEDEMKGRCSVCSYRFGVEHQPLPPPPPRYSGYTRNRSTHIDVTKRNPLDILIKYWIFIPILVVLMILDYFYGFCSGCIFCCGIVIVLVSLMILTSRTPRVPRTEDARGLIAGKSDGDSGYSGSIYDERLRSDGWKIDEGSRKKDR